MLFLLFALIEIKNEGKHIQIKLYNGDLVIELSKDFEFERDFNILLDELLLHL